MNNITRREVLKKMYQAVVAIGASSFISFDELIAANSNHSKKPAVIWLHGTSCSGCSVSFLNTSDIPAVDIITNFVDLVFHPDITASCGYDSIDIINKTMDSELPYIFVLEGAIPVKLPHACMMADKPITWWIEKLASKASLCIAAGTCSSFGGIAAMEGTLTGNLPFKKFMNEKKLPVPLVNLPGCPMKPEHLVYTLLHYIKLKKLPELDENQRPKHFFSKTIHERCIYYAFFQEDNFAEFIGDEGCLFRLGCQGPITNSDCLLLGYNGNTNNCIKSGHPCIGCASSDFPRKIIFRNYNDERSW